MIFDPDTETRSQEHQFALDSQQYPKQIKYLLENSAFYQEKLKKAGFSSCSDVGSLEEISKLPFTEKDEIRETQANTPPFGAHLAAPESSIRRVFSTSGTTGVPCYLGLTQKDLDMYATNVARGYTAAGFTKGQKIVVGFNAGPFVAGAVYYGFDKIGCAVIPVGTGNTERMITAIQRTGATGVSCTPSYGLYLIDWCQEHGIDTRSLGLKNMITAGEPGGGDPLIRGRIEDAFGCLVRESMGIGDITLSAWAEDSEGLGMHFMPRGFVHVELIDPVSGEPIPWDDGAQGELVYTALYREAMPLLRFRSRDHVIVTQKVNSSGRTGPRIRCIGRTDDMLIVRGVNFFPTSLRSILNGYMDHLSGMFQVRPTKNGVSQEPPLPIQIELNQGLAEAPENLKKHIQAEIRERLLITAEITFVSFNTLPRETYKSKLVQFPDH
ncbi:phenylacetate--CoA ligase family protein [Gammaproteobacteria bacterium]|nr:phenylacetate--CoA ligase family protein [Gammaproteobacteria bacterium]